METKEEAQAIFNRGYEQGYATGKIHAHRETHAHIVSMLLSVGGELVIDRASAEGCQGYNIEHWHDQMTGDLTLKAVKVDSEGEGGQP